MTDDSNGFTVVDKRKTVIEASGDESPSDEQYAVSEPAVESVEAAETNVEAAETNVEAAETNPEAEPSNQAPDVYMLVNYALQMFITTAWQRLGLWADPASGEVKEDLEQARIAIDVVGDLVGRLDSAPESSLSERDRRELKRILNDLRMNYVSRRAEA